MARFLSVVLLLLLNLYSFAQSDITEPELKKHIKFLASQKMQGRYPGTKQSAKTAKYIVRNFKKAGLKKAGDSYLQSFDARLRVLAGVTDTPLVKTYNVIGLIEGNDSELKNEYIVLGAHYDHLGMGGPSSRKKDTVGIHPGADDNASGTSSLLEIAEKLAANKKTLKRSILVVAFGAEEQGLLGSRHFVENPPVPLESVKLMINMDMVGRMNEDKQVYMGGAGTFPGGMEMMAYIGRSLNVNPVIHAGGVGGSDHVSFYDKQIPVIGIHTGGHPQYHTPEDTIDLINFEGQKLVSEYVYQAIFRMANKQDIITFIPQN